jgi:hypothetical protein
MFGNRGRILGSLLAGTLALGACDGGSTGSQTPRLSIKLTDAPGDLTEAWVDVQQVYLQGGNGKVVLRGQSTGLINLLTLKDDVASLVTDATVPAGTYSELRFVIGDAYVKTRAGTVYATQGAALPAGVTSSGTLNCPSCSQSGLKVKLPDGGVTLANESRVLAVDFDVSQSFGHPAGQSGQWVMHPVLRATDFTASGGISGTVALAQGVALPAACGGSPVAITQFVPRALVGTDTAASGAVDAGGAYHMRYVAPGTYTLGYAPSLVLANGQTLSFTATAQPASVTVASGGSATANYSITAATCQ